MFKSTTILAVRRNGKSALGGDGQVSFGHSVLKANANKIRTIHNGEVLTGFAGASADAFTLFEKFETRLEEFSGSLNRAAVELAKEWRTDRFLRRLEAQLVVVNKENMLLISGTGDVIEPDDDILAIGSGGTYAQSAATALMKHSKLSAREIVEESLKIAAKICIYTNSVLTIEEI